MMRSFTVCLLLLAATSTFAAEPQFAVAPFDAATAQKLQAAWAAHLKKEVVQTNSLGMKLALIPPGEFLMGSPIDEPGRNDNEVQHRVKLTKPFYLGVYEVTQREYENVMGKNPSWFSSTGPGKDDVAGLDTSRCPVEMVSWDDAVEFCRRLSAREGKTYRLPTEAGWEYACRAGTTTAYHAGPELTIRQANFGAYVVSGALRRTTSVGRYSPNGFGLYDMHGNVWELCSDWSGTYDETVLSDPAGPASGPLRVFRGGCWYRTPVYCRSAHRGGAAPEYGNDRLGFRVALVP